MSGPQVPLDSAEPDSTRPDHAWGALPPGGAIELRWPRLPLPGSPLAERGSPRAS